MLAAHMTRTGSLHLMRAIRTGLSDATKEARFICDFLHTSRMLRGPAQ